ncbi:MAG: alpha/beta fold hydrolase [Candidatus Eremiobacteraeota bacterium]|nr:alpha/beta fold hydrolase [Candidatus Eremiobacteraeota bacterium]
MPSKQTFFPASVFAIVLLGAFAARGIAAESTGALPDGTYRYDVTVDGRSVGESTIVIQRNGGTITMGESASVGGVALVSHRTLDESTFATLGYVVDIGATHAGVTFLGNQATLTQAGAHARIFAAPGAPFFVNDNMVGGFAQVPATLHASSTNKLTLACVACGGFVAIRLDATNESSGNVTLRIKGIAVALHFDPHTYVLARADVPAQHATFTLTSYDPHVSALPQPVLPTPLPLPPARYTSRDVTIRADDGVMLAGTLTMPNAARGLVPAFVFVHGSGCLDRDETVGPNKIFAQLANRLSSDGYAVLRYDKRSCGRSGGTFAVRERLIRDAGDVIAYLRAQPGVDPARIFVLGHSEGGELAPSIAIADGRLRGIVLLAPPAFPLEKILMQQTLRDIDASARAATQREEQTQLDAIAAGKSPGAANAWLRSSFGIDPAAIIARVPCPILIVQGTKDIQVLAADTPRLVAAARAANRTVSVVMLQGDDHLFIALPPDEQSTGVEYYTPSYLDPALFLAIESWLAGQM